MTTIPSQLEKIWSTPEEQRDPSLNLLLKILNNIKSNPNNDKFKQMNMTKIRKKFKDCPGCLYFLFSAGFQQDPFDGSRLRLDPIQGMTMLNEALDELNRFIHKKKNPTPPKETEEKSEPKTDKKDTITNNNDDVDDEEMEKALKMSMENTENTDTTNKEKMDVDKDNNNEEDPLAELDDETRNLFAELRAHKGTTTVLRSSDLQGLSKEEKLKKVEELRTKFRKEKKNNEVKQKLDRERRRRENTKMAMETRRKQKDYETKMMAKRKRRDKEQDKIRKQRIRDKIKQDRERKKQQEKYRKEALERQKKEQQNKDNTNNPNN